LMPDTVHYSPITAQPQHSPTAPLELYLGIQLAVLRIYLYISSRHENGRLDLLTSEKRSTSELRPCSYRQVNSIMDNRILSYATAQPDPDTRVPEIVARLPANGHSDASMESSPSTSPPVRTPAETSKSSCIYAELLDAIPIHLEHELCCTVGHKDDERDYFLLEHIRSGHYSSRCSLLAADENVAVEMAPVRMEMPWQ
jgi:hypothetical protein